MGRLGYVLHGNVLVESLSLETTKLLEQEIGPGLTVRATVVEEDVCEVCCCCC